MSDYLLYVLFGISKIFIVFDKSRHYLLAVAVNVNNLSQLIQDFKMSQN